ncbi:hypothetical protein MJO28_008335 [Puccinia striiformis f. sp. tritici]|uniref:Alkaline phosphatase n=2 Tax=Puccinia striiformis f. sp. tritici TaxID=168172 RepID=A0A0L0V433_9BASI|nr:hypothetical protein Pst134EA_015573 [Puccinia striiformis f. sp. tritici]KNE93744.1 hypothetical protein PSTG_12847 [Puccinia striiformis f. sp. tritici PST-78]KAH9452743.1 hypothetical protein Pst134EB_016695 [Puccinia striiformis f. sp. tritici]KAH9463491.1 hypothetical protein Pst134EA_015573 [Puccinia striiformis f. sp. tritici]KAI7949514.1 hypothetical protein MJO28_008335 [Puccinia striiformis f. sp. tritici]KAI7952614.1 hypothetical protein MJO29_008245 [Puccinia striiformis f. sp. 
MRYSTPVPLRPVEYKDSEEREEEDDRLDELDELDKLHGPSSPGLFSGTSLPNSRLSIFHSSATQYDSSPNQADYDQDYKNSLEDSQTLHPIHLEGGQEPSPLKPRRTQSLQYKPPAHTKRVLFFGTSALIGLAYLIVFFATQGTRYGHSVKINVILMISDGFGPASESFARGFVQHLQNLTVEEQAKFSRWTFPETTSNSQQSSIKRPTGPSKNKFGTLPLDPLLVGSSRTRSSNSLITDSAAGATAFSCALKTYNGAIAVEPVEQKPCGTVLEAAKHRGYLTGLVATSRITHATPASFYAHVIDRDMESKIATFLTGEGPLGRNVDLAFGGGRRFFLPSSSLTSSRSDDNDLLGTAQSKYGFTIINSTDAFEKAWDPRSSKGHFKTPVLGLFNDNHMNYEIDRLSLEGTEKREPSLRNMSLAALQTLSREAKDKSAHGFFLMIEGSRIDMAAHSNDPVGHLYDILAYQETVRTVQSWVDEANKAGWPTLMISVSDHETGGLALGRQLTEKYPVYAWYPEVLANATHSTAWLAKKISMAVRPSQSVSRQFIVDEILKDGLGIVDASVDEIDKLVILGSTQNVDYLLADMISRRAQVGWSTHGHSGVDVNLYGYPADLTKDLFGNRENTEIGQFIVDAMDIDLDIVTRDLNRLAKSWHVTDANHNPNLQNFQLKHYSHEF